MIFLLDTDTLTLLHRGRSPRLMDHLKRLGPGDICGTTIVTKIESLRGRFDQLLKASTGAEIRRAQDRLIELEDALTEIEILPFDVEAVRHFDKLRKAKPGQMGHADLIVASIVLARKACLVTRDRHFQPLAKSAGLLVENWID